MRVEAMTIPEKIGVQMAEEFRVKWINSRLPADCTVMEPLRIWDLMRLYDVALHSNTA